MRTLRIIARHQGSPVPHLDFYAMNPPVRRWLPLGKIVEVRFMPEWLTEIRANVVIAADEATAKLARVQFDQKAVDEALAPVEAPAPAASEPEQAKPAVDEASTKPAKSKAPTQ